MNIRDLTLVPRDPKTGDYVHTDPADFDRQDNIDTCLVCGKEIPPGPDFCSEECESRKRAHK